MGLRLDADLVASHGPDAVRIRAEGSSVVLSIPSPLAALRLRRAAGSFRLRERIREFSEATGVAFTVRVMGLPVWRARRGK